MLCLQTEGRVARFFSAFRRKKPSSAQSAGLESCGKQLSVAEKCQSKCIRDKCYYAGYNFWLHEFISCDIFVTLLLDVVLETYDYICL
jgi:hypothetical protein